MGGGVFSLVIRNLLEIDHWKLCILFVYLHIYIVLYLLRVAMRALTQQQKKEVTLAAHRGIRMSRLYGGTFYFFINYFRHLAKEIDILFF